MMRKLLWALGSAFAFFGMAAGLELVGFQSTLGVFSHTVPAGLLAALFESSGMEMPRRGVILGHAHGPPFLRPFGVLLIYGAPAAMLAVALWRTRGAKHDATVDDGAAPAPPTRTTEGSVKANQ